MNIFIGNLAFEAKEEDVHKVFMAFGKISSFTIVKDKKGKNSRGFGFIEMPNEEEALAAISGLNGTELLGRQMNVMPALSKKEKGDSVKTEDRRGLDEQPVVNKDLDQDAEVKEAFGPRKHIRRGSRYKQGRRTRSFLMKRKEAGIAELPSERKFKANPMRWRKKQQPKPWQKDKGEVKPWRRGEHGTGPWRKPEGVARPWRRPGGESKPWEKRRGTFGSRERSEGESNPWRKPEGEVKPWSKERQNRKPWMKSGDGSGKPRRSGGTHAKRSGFGKRGDHAEKRR
jgi:hypothetical protein